MHGSYRRVDESLPALRLIGQHLSELGAAHCLWLFDQPVSNSGRIARLAEELAGEHGWNWRSELCPNPDARLRVSPHVVVSADSVILDDCQAWFDLAGHVVRSSVHEAWIFDLE